MSAARAAAVVLVTLILQVCLFSQFSYDGAKPDLILLLAILAGFQLGPERGAILGFAGGLAFDVVLNTPLGLAALIGTLTAYGVGNATTGFVRASWWLTPAVAAATSAAAMIVYAAVGEIIGLATLSGGNLAAMVVVVPAVNAVLAPLMERAVRWVRTDERHHHQAFYPR